MESLVYTLVITQVLLAALSAPVVMRKVAPNGLCGFRTPLTLSDDRIWYTSNVAVGQWLLLETAVSAGFSLAFLHLFRSPMAPVGALALHDARVAHLGGRLLRLSAANRDLNTTGPKLASL